MGGRGWKPVLLAGAVILAAPAQADTLREALIDAYRTNPTLQAARAQQRAIDENVAIEKAAGRPQVDATGQYIEFFQQSSDSFGPDRSVGVGLDLGVPIYSGGAIRNAVRAAETRVDAGQADLRATQSALFSNVTAVYMDVMLNEAVVGLSANQVEVLDVTLQATSDRFEIGILTRTDVAQARSRLALARGDLRAAQSNLIAAREDYIALVGEAPTNLQPPPPLPGLPENVGTAVDVALQENPDLIAAAERADAAGYDIDVAGAGRLPRVSIFTGGDYSNFLGSRSGGDIPGTLAQTTNAAQAGVQVSIPIFQGGRPAALERQAQARAAAALEQVIAVERDVIAQVRSAWSSWQAALAIVESSQVAVAAAELSLEGVRAENSIGNRTVIDVLDAEQELLNTRVQLVTARRNAYVAGFSLLAAMGRAEARDLGLGEDEPLYDPQVNYERVRDRWWDWESDPDPVVQSTRTVDIPPPDADIRTELEPDGGVD